MSKSNVAKLKKIAFQHKADVYFLQICLLGLYSEWEGGIKRKIDAFLEEVNKQNKTKFKIEKERFFNSRILNHEEFKKVWNAVFGVDYEKGCLIDSSFFKQRNKYAHGNFSSMELEYRQFEKYANDINKMLCCFEEEIDNFIKNGEYLER